MMTAGRREWQEVHETTPVVDLHAHPSLKMALFGRDLGRRYGPGSRSFNPWSVRTSFPKLAAGGVDVLLSAVYAPEIEILADLPLLKPVLRYGARRVWREMVTPTYYEVTVRTLRKMEEQVAAYNEARQEGGRAVAIAHSVQELERYLGRGAERPMVLVHCVEGGHSLQGEVSGKGTGPAGAGDGGRVAGDDRGVANEDDVEAEILAHLDELFHAYGVAYMTLAHFYPNRLVAPTLLLPEDVLWLARWRKMLERYAPGRGLTPLGERVVERMLELGMIVDVSHCTPAARSRIYTIAEANGKRARVMASHVGAYALHPDPYNLKDWEIRWIADHGGVVGIIFVAKLLKPWETEMGLNVLSRTIEHVIDVGGASCAAIGTDFDGFTVPPLEMVDASQLPRLTRRLLSEYGGRGEKAYKAETVRKLLGGNVLAMLREGWGKQKS